MSSSKAIKLSIEPRITSSELWQCLRIKDRIVKEQGPGLSCGHSQCLELRPRRRNNTRYDAEAGRKAGGCDRLCQMPLRG